MPAGSSRDSADVGGRGARRASGGGGGPSASVSMVVLFVLMGVANAALYPFLSLLLRDRGLPADRIGLALAAMSISGLVSSTVGGNIADTVLGRLATLRLAAALTVLAAFALSAAGSGFVPVVLAATALSFCVSPITPVGDALALQHLGDERRGEYGGIRLWSSAGFAVAVVGFGALFQGAGLGVMLPAFAVAIMTVPAWSVIGSLPRGLPAEEQGERGLRAAAAVLRATPRLLPILTAVFLVAVGGTASFFFLGLRIAGLGGGPFLVGLATALGAAAEVPVMGLSARLSRAIGLRGAFVLGAVAYIGVFVALASLRSPVGMAIVFTGEGIGFGLVYVSTVVIVDNLVPPALRATGQGLRQTFQFGIAPVVGSAVGGYVYSRFGAPALFLSAAAVAVGGTVLSWIALAGSEFARREA